MANVPVDCAHQFAHSSWVGERRSANHNNRRERASQVCRRIAISPASSNRIPQHLTYALLRTVRRFVFTARFQAPHNLQNFRRRHLCDRPRSQEWEQQIPEGPFGLLKRCGSESLFGQPLACDALKSVRTSDPRSAPDGRRIATRREELASFVAALARALQGNVGIRTQTDHALASSVAVPHTPETPAGCCNQQMKPASIAQLVRLLLRFGGANSRLGELCHFAGTIRSHIGVPAIVPALVLPCP